MRLLLVLVLLSIPAARADDAYRRSVEDWRKTTESDVDSPRGWLAVIGLFWLRPGESSFGSAADSAIRLPSGSLPARAGKLILDGSTVYIEPARGSGLSIGGKPVVERTLLHTDQDAQPDEVHAGRLTLQVLERQKRLGVRVWDPESPARKAFSGRVWYPVQDGFRITGEFHPFAKSREVPIRNAVGMDLTTRSPGTVKFLLGGRSYELVAESDDPAKGLFVNFRDATNGGATYKAGRFLDVDPPKDGKVVLDFNRATSPPCAFTDFATCPLAPRQNQLPVAIEAGEKSSGRRVFNKTRGMSPK